VSVPFLAGTGGYTSLIDIVDSVNVAVEIAGLVMHTSFAESAVLVRARNSSRVRVRAHNNILNVSGAAVGFVAGTGNRNGSGFGVGFNTVLVRSTSTATPVPLLGIGDGVSESDKSTVWFGCNFIANHFDSRFIVTGAVVGANNDFFHGSNVYGGTQSYLLPYYNTSGAGYVLGQDRTCSYDASDAVCGVKWYNDDIVTGYTANDISGYWPVQGGKLLGAGSEFLSIADSDLATPALKSLLDGFGVVDISGNLRATGPIGSDAGACAKSVLGAKVTYHVNLSNQGSESVIGTGTGSHKSPLSVRDWLRLHSRLAPCHNEVEFVLRGSNYNPALSRSGGIIFDLGPSINNAPFAGTGSVTITGYRTYVKKPPVLAVSRINAATQLQTSFSKLKILWTEGSDLIYCDPSRDNNSGSVTFSKSVIRTTPNTCAGAIVSAGLNAPILGFVGNTLDVRHIAGTGSGLFTFGSGINTEKDFVFGNVIVMPGTGTVVGSSDIVIGTGARFDANYINCVRGQAGVSGTPAWSFVGDVGQHNTASVHALDLVFKDANNADFSAADYTLTGDVVEPRDRIATSLVPAYAYSLYMTDIRDCLRDASVGSHVGSATGDAGAYEFSYAIPATTTYYVDLGRSGSGHRGARNDRWSYSDLAAYLTGLSNSVLETPVLIRCLGTGIATTEIVIDNADAMPYATLRIEAESPFSLPTLHVAVGATWLTLRGGAGFIFGIDSVIVTSASPFPIIECVTGADITLTQSARDTEDKDSGSEIGLFNSIFHRIESGMVIVTDTTTLLLAQATLNATLTIGGVVKRFGTDIVVAATASVSEAATAIASAFNHDNQFKAAGYVALPVGGGAVAFDGPSGIAMSDAVAGIVLHNNTSASYPLVNVGLSHKLAVIGSGFAMVRDAGCSRSVNAITAKRGVVAYSSFTSDTNASSGSDSVAVFGTTSLVTEFNASHGFWSGCVFNALDTGSIKSANIVAQDALNKSVYALNFKAVGEAIDIAPASSFSADVRAYNIDYDALRSLRVTSTSSMYDAGPVEVQAIEIDSTLADASEPAISGLTEEGSTWNSRKATDGFGFKIVGYAVSGSGYAAYAVNRTVPYRQLSKPGSVRITLTDNVFESGDSLGFVFGTGPDAASVSITYNTYSGWKAGSNIGESLQNIATALRASVVFNLYCYCYVVSSTLVVVSRRFHASANSYTCSCSFVPNGVGMRFSGAVTNDAPANKVWPRYSPYAVFDRMEEPEQGSRGFVVRLGFEDCNYPIGQLAVIAECVSSAIPGEVGTRCVYAFANMPLHVKHNREVVVKRIIFQF
jgi:hypothetical protein